ncbi:MAG: hypothetical protein KDC53_08085 [Saprospiraceae bacterium]|nr:hypothetical protein [Saprospiraceae bacterium]
MKYRILSLLMSMAVLAACKEKTATDASSMAPAEEKVEVKEIQLVPAEASTAFNDASLDKMTYQNGKFNFTYSGKDYKLGEQTTDAPLKMCANSLKGQHIHLIIDDQPYLAEYTPEFELDITDGPHTIVAFLSRSYHESIKNGKAFLAKKVVVKNKSFASEEDIKDPMLVYSRPKGEYVGRKETDRVMLDFFLVNVDLGSDYKMRVEINDSKSFAIEKWQPYYLDNLPLGENKIKLTLFDRQGIANIPNNPVERKIVLQKDPAFSM